MIQSRNREIYFRYWQSLVIIFLYLSIDETSVIHERLNKVDYFFKTGGFFYFAWVIPAIFMVSIFVLFYLRFLAHLRPKTSRLFWLSGIIYVLGALGIEMIGASIAESSGEGLVGLTYTICAHFEEGFELLSLSIFIYALLDYLHFKLQNSVIYVKE
ncbi:hypothetical protein [Altericista sp. CCNU0014]|uniref:hypothetical protein n=1 Tax=Altericista sp. CCNU0014 TaxID=3082949 RepID=UPI003850853E